MAVGDATERRADHFAERGLLDQQSGQAAAGGVDGERNQIAGIGLEQGVCGVRKLRLGLTTEFHHPVQIDVVVDITGLIDDSKGSDPHDLGVFPAAVESVPRAR